MCIGVVAQEHEMLKEHDLHKVCSTGSTLLGESRRLREVMLAGMDHAYSDSIARIYCLAGRIAKDHSLDRALSTSIG